MSLYCSDGDGRDTLLTHREQRQTDNLVHEVVAVMVV